MLESLNFHYNGVASTTMGLQNIKMDSNLFEEAFLADRKVIYERIKGKEKSYHFGVELEPLKFKLTFAFSSGFTDATLRTVAGYFNQTTFKPFYFDLMPERIIYCMPDGDSTLHHTGNNTGYFEIEMISNSPYFYGTLTTDTAIDLTANDIDGTTITFTNSGDVDLYPELWITTVGTGDISIVNSSNGNIEFLFEDLAAVETVYIDNQNEDIVTDITLTYRYDNFNNTYLCLKPGTNNLLVTGQCTLQFRYQFKYLAGCEIPAS